MSHPCYKCVNKIAKCRMTCDIFATFEKKQLQAYKDRQRMTDITVNETKYKAKTKYMRRRAGH